MVAPVTVAVADPQLTAALAAAPGVDPALRFVEVALDQPLSAEARDAQVLVPGFLAGDEATSVMQQLPALRLVQLVSAGAEVWVGRTPPGVALCTASGAHGGSTAEWTVGALLSVLHEFPGFTRSQDRGVWDRHFTDELAGKRVLVLGAGDLGTQVARRLKAFDATVTMAARTARDGIIAIDEVPDVLGEHDVVILMVPLTPETAKLVDAAFLAAMPDGAVLVNAARGAVVDTDALLTALGTGRLRAALDVTEPEPLPPGHPLWTAPNLFITPHIAGAVPGAAGRARAVVVAQLGRFVRGEDLQNVVEVRGY